MKIQSTTYNLSCNCDAQGNWNKYTLTIYSEDDHNGTDVMPSYIFEKLFGYTRAEVLELVNKYDGTINDRYMFIKFDNPDNAKSFVEDVCIPKVTADFLVKGKDVVKPIKKEEDNPEFESYCSRWETG